jgi:hypothetical protein
MYAVIKNVYLKSVANKSRTEFLRYKLKMGTCSRKQDISGGGSSTSSSCSSSSNKINVVDLQRSKK